MCVGYFGRREREDAGSGVDDRVLFIDEVEYETEGKVDIVTCILVGMHGERHTPRSNRRFAPTRVCTYCAERSTCIRHRRQGPARRMPHDRGQVGRFPEGVRHIS